MTEICPLGISIAKNCSIQQIFMELQNRREGRALDFIYLKVKYNVELREILYDHSDVQNIRQIILHNALSIMT